ncbi:MAG: hypothetical protein JW757_09695, partial [Anaerolineales bacterium]|nr:hypothetical protein [Anaerolineales bacterium]
QKVTLFYLFLKVSSGLTNGSLALWKPGIEVWDWKRARIAGDENHAPNPEGSGWAYEPSPGRGVGVNTGVI